MTGEVARLGGDIRSLVTLVDGESQQGEITMKVTGVKREDLMGVLEKVGVKVIDVREAGTPYQPRLISSY